MARFFGCLKSEWRPKCFETTIAEIKIRMHREQHRAQQAPMHTLLKQAHIPPRFASA